MIFIGGSSFSGSTMLDMMLSNSKKGFSVGEAYALFRPYRPHHFHPVCGCGNPKCDFWRQIRSAGEKCLYQSIFSVWPEISFIVDSSKDPWWIKKQSEILHQRGVEVHHLLIWKEPAAFAHSMLKRGKKRWIKSWKDYYRLYSSLIGDFLPVSYDELAQYPAGTLQKICNKVGVVYHADQEKFWGKQHHTLFGNDSAKIHLHESSSRSFRRCKTEIVQDNNSVKHRTIYHDRSYLNALPKDVSKAIANDSVFADIIMQFESNDLHNFDRGEIRFSSAQIFFAKLRWVIRAGIGRILGRFWYIY